MLLGVGLGTMVLIIASIAAILSIEILMEKTVELGVRGNCIVIVLMEKNFGDVHRPSRSMCTYEGTEMKTLYE
jgi:hypothetical protein